MGTWEEGGLHAGAVWYSHYQPAARASPASPLATVAAFTPPVCLLTQGRLPQGRRCRLGNEGVQGPPKQAAAGPLRIPGTPFWGGGGRLQVPILGGPRKRQSLCPWNGERGAGGPAWAPRSESPESACPDTPLPWPQGLVRDSGHSQGSPMTRPCQAGTISVNRD